MAQTLNQPTFVLSHEVVGSEIQDLGAGVSYQWRRGGSIVVFYGTNATASAADIWADAAVEAANLYFREKQFLAMHIMHNLPFTPYIRHKSKEISLGTATLTGRVAIVLRPSMFTSIIQKFVDYDLKNVNQQLVRRIFTAESIAEKWLAELL